MLHDYHPATDMLADRVILVTGAGDGIGRAAALAFAAHGATIILLGRTPSRLEQVYDEIERAGKPQPAIYPMNLEGATPKDYDDLAATLHQEFGHLDGLLHNAAMLGTLTPFELYNIETWYQVMQVNLHAPFLLTRSCLRLLKNAADASVVFTIPDVGRQGRAYWGAYAVSKAGNLNMMQILADECEVNTSVRVNCIDPGAVRTQLRLCAYPGVNPNRFPSPDEIMGAYLYLMGPDSKDVNGQVISAQVEK
jgi:NAD(P)-dependent dehydrogenase (short-subunit alcohol dehydrogenase family)